MSFVAWIVLGLAAGFIGNGLVSREKNRFPLDVLLGVVGGVSGGWLCYTFGPPGVNGLNLLSLFAAGDRLVTLSAWLLCSQADVTV